MSAFLPLRPSGVEPDPDHPTLRQRPYGQAEQRARWEVRAAQWRAREVAESVFGHVGHTALLSLRGDGPVRGLLHMEVPFSDLDAHRELEHIFQSVAASDPILSRVPLVYVVGPEQD